jgi:hypothetical protein
LSGIQNLEVPEFRSIILIENRREKIGTEKNCSVLRSFRISEVPEFGSYTVLTWLFGTNNIQGHLERYF